jgi:hypothetical protein
VQQLHRFDSCGGRIGFGGGIHPKEYGFFVFADDKRNEIAYSPVSDTLSFKLAVRWYDNAGAWRAGVPEAPEDPDTQWSLAKGRWATEAEMQDETLGDRKRKYPFFIDTLYK